MEQIEQVLIYLAAAGIIGVIICFGELTIHRLQLRRVAQKEADGPTGNYLLNDALTAAGITCAALWLLMVLFVIDDGMALARVLAFGLLLLGCIGAIWLYWRVRFRP